MRTNTSLQPTILRRRQVEQRTGLARSTLYQYIKDGDFPPPVQLGLRAVGWFEVGHQRVDRRTGEASPPRWGWVWRAVLGSRRRCG